MSIEINDDFNFKTAYRTLNGYLAKVETDMTNEELIADGYTVEEIVEINAYDDATVGSRGADDGTFDYCGGYVFEIIETIERCLNKK